jgi:hypothetical protein
MEFTSNWRYIGGEQNPETARVCEDESAKIMGLMFNS